MIPIYQPYLPNSVLQHAHTAIDSKWISSNGEYLNLAIDELKNICETKYVILCNNGTTATHLVSVGLNLKYPNIKNIIVPNNVYVAAWNSFLTFPKFNLIPVDCNVNTWNVDLNELDITINQHSPEDTAVLIVHNIGNIINVPELKVKHPGFIFIEDNCEGFLGEYNGVKSGSKSLLSSVSFYGNKTITCGEGGALFTDDDELFEYLNSAKSQGITNKKFVHDKIGYNYRMTNIEAALLHGQLKVLSEIIDKKNEVFQSYYSNLSGVVEFQTLESNTKPSNWMLGVKFPKNVDIDKMALNLYQKNIETRPMFPPIHYHNHLKHIPANTTNAEYLYRHCLILPSYPELNKQKINYICEAIKSNLK